jgi:cyclopropane fatty-acyl-phospholipid synthase-like methyltransferase
MKNKTSGVNNPMETWDARFSGDDYIFGTSPNHYLVQSAPMLTAGMNVLVVADGEGRNSVWLAQQGMETTAFDISSVGVAKARKLAHLANVEVQFAVSDCDSWDWAPDRYDAVVAVFIQFADPEMRARLFANMMKTLKVGGVLILQGYTPKQLEYNTGGPPDIAHLYTENLLSDVFATFDILDLKAYEMQMHEGLHHAGMSALIGMVARKRSEA